MAVREPVRLQVGVVDLGRQRLVTPDGAVSLTTREAELLAYLVERSGKAVPREDLLTDVWAYRATHPTRAVDLAVKRLRAKIERDPSEPVHILSVHGVGYRFVPAGPELTPAHVDLGSQYEEAPRTNLSSERTSFVGRARELAGLAALFEDGAALVTVMGAAGTGKTRLARRLGVRWLDDDRVAGVWFADLSEARDAAGVSAALAGALGVALDGPTDAVEQLGHALAERARAGTTLVILDNFEQVASHAPGTLGRWLRVAAQTRFLVTSRERLNVRGERILELAPLPVEEGLELLLDRAHTVRRTLRVGDSDREVLSEVVTHLDGIPLAIELAASRLAVLSPPQLLQRLASRFRLLGDPRGDRPPRHATLRRALDWSWELMTEHERTALAALSVFEGGFTLEAAEEVLEEGAAPDAPWPADLVQSLRDKSLIAMDGGAGVDVRYRLLESIRAYAAEHLDASEAARTRARHAAYYLREAEELARTVLGAGGRERLEDLVLERANVLAVAERGAEPDERARATLALAPALRARGPVPVLESLLERLLASEGVGDLLIARALTVRGGLLRGHGRLAEAGDALEQALELGRADGHVQARAYTELGQVRMQQGRLEEAAAQQQAAVALCLELGDGPTEGRARMLHAEVCARLDDLDAAEVEYEHGLRAVRRAGDRWTEGLLAASLACFLLEHRRAAAEAEARAEEALALLEEMGDRFGQVSLLGRFAIALVRMGRIEDALWHLERAEDIARRMGDRARLGEVLAIHGWARIDLCHLDEAEQLIERALELSRETGDLVRQGYALRLFAMLRQEQQRFPEAEARFRDALAVSRAAGEFVELAVTQATVGMYWLDADRVPEALAVLAQARHTAAGTMRWVDTQTLGFTAVARAAEGELADAERALEEVIAHIDPRDPREAALVEPWRAMVQLVRARLEEPERVDEAVARALAMLDGSREGAMERRLALRLLERELDRTTG